MLQRDASSLPRYIPVFVGAVAGIVLSLATFFVVGELESVRASEAFKNKAAATVSSVRSHILANLQTIRSIVALYDSSGPVDRNEFRIFTAPILAHTKGIQALEWIPRVPGGERAMYEQKAQEDGYIDFRFTEMTPEGEMIPVAARAEYFPVFYVEPYYGNEGVLGFDLASHPSRWATLQAARDSGQMQATGGIVLAQGPADERGFLVAAPVYGGQRSPDQYALGQRQARLIGFALGVFRLGGLIGAAIADVGGARAHGLDLYVYDEDAEKEDRLLHVYRSRRKHDTAGLLDERDVRSGVHLVDTFDVAGRDWTIVAVPSGDVLTGAAHWQPWAAVFAGLGATGILAAYLFFNLKRTDAFEALVSVRTAELQAVNDELRRGIAERETAEAALRDLSKLAKYLSPQVYKSIFTGRQQVAITSQRKKLSVFFCDIAEFTETAEHMESEDVTALLNEYLTEMSRIALSYGATIDKYIGDGIMVFFGDPESGGVKEDALACVKMAMAMQERLRELQETSWGTLGLPRPIRCRMGISTGYCTVGNFGSEDRMDYTIIGSGVNLASRLEAAAPPGGILISSETHALVREEVVCGEELRINVKGSPYPVAAYRVVDLCESVRTGGSVIREEEARIRLELDLRAMSTAERDQAVWVLRRALSRLTASDG